MLLKKIYFYFILLIINKMLAGTRFFKIKNVLLNRVGPTIGKGTKIVGPLYINFNSGLIIGDNCWIGKDFTIHGNGKTFIGNNCDIAPNVTILNGTHEIGTPLRRAGDGKTLNTTIKDGSWIGASSILIGSIINEASIVAAGSIVTKEVKSNTLVGGNPAKIIKELS